MARTVRHLICCFSRPLAGNAYVAKKKVTKTEQINKYYLVLGEMGKGIVYGATLVSAVGVGLMLAYYQENPERRGKQRASGSTVVTGATASAGERGGVAASARERV